MGKSFIVAFMVPAALLLAGCFESAMPLIAARGADYPFSQGFRYTLYIWKADQRQWVVEETGAVTRAGDHYNQIGDAAAGREGNPFLLKTIGGGFFVGQQPEGSSYAYDLVKVEGDTVYQYGLACAEDDRKFAGQGLIDKITTDSLGGDTCTVSSFENLARVFQAIAAENRQPQGKYQIER